LDQNLARELSGLKRRLEQDDWEYVEDSFSEDYESGDMGKTKVVCFLSVASRSTSTARL
jgi:hypothetical protein